MALVLVQLGAYQAAADLVQVSGEGRQGPSHVHKHLLSDEGGYSHDQQFCPGSS